MKPEPKAYCGCWEEGDKEKPVNDNEIAREIANNSLMLEAMRHEADLRGMERTMSNYVKLYKEWGPKDGGIEVS